MHECIRTHVYLPEHVSLLLGLKKEKNYLDGGVYILTKSVAFIYIPVMSFRYVDRKLTSHFSSRCNISSKYSITNLKQCMSMLVHLEVHDCRGGSLKILSLAGLAKLSRLRYNWLRFGLASAGYRGLGVHDRLAYTAS